MKKPSRLAVGLICALMAALMLVPVSAHGCHGGRRRHSRPAPVVQTVITVCPYEDCELGGRHIHDDTTYCGYSHSTGTCDGACRALCALEDCALSGRHTHDGVTYCGSHHDAGFCDGSCAVAVSYGHGHCHGGGC